MTKTSMIRYESFSKAINVLPKDHQLNAYSIIINYWLYWVEPDESSDPFAYAIFIMAKPQIDANNKRFINGTKWWRPSKQEPKEETKQIAYLDKFEEFWKLYPKKKWKQNAVIARNNAMIKGIDPERIIKKSWEYAKEIKLKRVEEKYIKYANWWINEWRYDDEYFTWKPNEKPDLDILY